MTAARPPDTLDQLVADLGVTGRRLGDAIDGVLDGGPVDEVVQRSGLPRRTVERLLRIDASDAELRQLRAVVGNHSAEVPDPPAEAVARIEALVAAAPAAKRQLDHVSATASTAARRAVWLADRFLLAGRRLVLTGDHDLTSLAAAPLLPETEIVVVDVDEHLLEFIDRSARHDRLPITCVYADLTVSLPEAVSGSAHVVFTDPPYTPAGVATFVARSIEALRADQPARIVLAYGFSPDHPTLGLQVQRELIALELAIEAIEPGFNRYHGAQAIGGRSDLYTLIPTTRSAKAASKVSAAAGQAIYTHGERSLEARPSTLGRSTRRALLARAGISDPPDDAAEPSTTWIGTRDHDPPATVTSARQLFQQLGQRHTKSVAASLLDGSDAWLGRVLIAATADRLALLVPNSHPDIVDAPSQAALRALVAGRYELSLLRSQPSDRTAIVVADRVEPPAATLLDRPAATLRTAIHNALYNRSRALGDDRWSKADVTTVVDELLAEIGGQYSAINVTDLPRSIIVAASQLAADRAARTSGSSPSTSSAARRTPPAWEP